MHPIFQGILDTLRSLRKGAAPVSPGTSGSVVITELNHQQTDDNLVEHQEGDVEIRTNPEVHDDGQLNGEPHTSPAFNMDEERFLKLHSEDQASHLFHPDVDVNTVEQGEGVDRAGPSISDGDAADERINKFSSKKVLIFDDLRLKYPNVAMHLARYGVLMVDRATFESFYEECTRKAMLAQKPISEVLRDA